MTRKPATAEAILAMDVGGTTIDAAVVTADGAVAGDVRRVASPGVSDASTIVTRLTGVLADLHRSAEAAGLAPAGAGVAMPGPFDYERGVSWMRHKLPAIRGLPLKEPLEGAIQLPVRFCNDAVAFALGAWWREHPGQQRLAGVTIGTGLGAGFVVHGRAVGEEEGAPPGAVVWNAPWHDGILEDFVSGPAVERAYTQRGGRPLAASDIAILAWRSDSAAAAAFADLGTALGQGLASTIAEFRPTRVVCGGQIAKAFGLFGSRAQAAYARTAGAEVTFRPATSPHLSLVGAARHAASTLG